MQELLEHTARFVSGSDASASPHAVLWDASATQNSSLVWGRLLQVNHPCQLTLIFILVVRVKIIPVCARGTVEQGALWHRDAMLVHRNS